MHVVADARRDHILSDKVTAANARVVATGNDIAQPRFNSGFNYDLGYCARKLARTGPSTNVATGGGIVRRKCPAGFSRKTLIDSMTASRLSSSGRSCANSRSPASVGARCALFG